MKLIKILYFLYTLFLIKGFSNQDSTIKEIFQEEFFYPLNSPETGICTTDILQIHKTFPFQRMVDIGCGIVNWPESTKEKFSYTGIDIVDSIINKNNKNMPDNVFLIEDITQDPLPLTDLILCRNCLEYFSYLDLFLTLKNCQNSRSTYLLLSINYTCDNKDTPTGIRRDLNFQKEPFYFPPPLYQIIDSQQKESHLALWRIDSIDLSPLEKFLFPPLTILSKPIGKPLHWEHSGVASSLKRGLYKAYKSKPSYFNINPDLAHLVKNNVLVISDLTAGKQAYDLKKENKISKLLVGPNIVSSVIECNGFVTWPLIDAYVVPSSWVEENMVRFAPILENRIVKWFAGVNENYWKPTQKHHQKNNPVALVYRKTHPALCDQIEQILRNIGYTVLSVNYGKYNAEDYRNLLNQSQFAVFISVSESQGIALAEAWSMDVPTLVWNPETSIYYAGFEYTNTSAAPYLSPMTGKSWKTIEEFTDLVSNFSKIKTEFNPRRWTLLHMTDKISVETLLSYFREPTNE